MKRILTVVETSHSQNGSQKSRRVLEVSLLNGETPLLDQLGVKVQSHSSGFLLDVSYPQSKDNRSCVEYHISMKEIPLKSPKCSKNPPLSSHFRNKR